MGPIERSKENYPDLEHIKLKFVFETKSFQSPIGIWYIYGTDQKKYNITIALSQDDRFKFANYVNELQPYLRDKLIHHTQKEKNKADNHYKQIYYLFLHMKEKTETYALRMDDSSLFKSINKHEIYPKDRKVNTFTDLNHIYCVYKELSRSRDYSLATPQYDDATARLLAINEQQVDDELTHNLKFDIDPILVGDQENPIKLFKDFRGFYLSNYNAFTANLEHNVQNILNWSIFKFASLRNNLSLDFVTQKAEFLSKVVNSLTALLYAKFLGNKEHIGEDDWFKFKASKEYKILLPLRKILSDLKRPIATRMVENGEQGMSIAAAVTDLKGRFIG